MRIVCGFMAGWRLSGHQASSLIILAKSLIIPCQGATRLSAQYRLRHGPIWLFASNEVYGLTGFEPLASRYGPDAVRLDPWNGGS